MHRQYNTAQMPCHLEGVCETGIAFTAALLVTSTVVCLWAMLRMTRALETLAMINALDELEDRFSDIERADLEGRVREHLFAA